MCYSGAIFMFHIIGILLAISGLLIGLFLPSIFEKVINQIRRRESEETKEELTTYCKSSKDYILLGLGNSIMYMMLYYIGGIPKEPITQTGWIELIIYCITATLLLAVVVIDWNTYEIPFGINVCILLLGLIRVGLDYHNWSLYIIGFFAVSGFLFLLYWISGGSWIGGGDVKLMAAAGLLLGWKQIVVAFVVGCVLGSIIHLTIMAVSKSKHMLAFGPYLSMGIYFSMLWGEQLASWYLSLFKI